MNLLTSLDEDTKADLNNLIFQSHNDVITETLPSRRRYITNTIPSLIYDAIDR